MATAHVLYRFYGAGLAGKRFHTTEYCAHRELIAVWQGWIIATPATDILLVELHDWGVGQPNGQQLIRLSDFVDKEPLLYASDDEMWFNYQSGTLAHSRVCHEMPPPKTFAALFESEPRYDTCFGYVTASERKELAEASRAKWDAMRACTICDEDGYRGRVVCDHVDRSGRANAALREFRQTQLETLYGGAD